MHVVCLLVCKRKAPSVWLAICISSQKRLICISCLIFSVFFFVFFSSFASHMNINVEHGKLWCQWFRIDLLNEKNIYIKFHCLYVGVAGITHYVLKSLYTSSYLMKRLVYFHYWTDHLWYEWFWRFSFSVNKFSCLFTESMLACCNCTEV